MVDTEGMSEADASHVPASDGHDDGHGHEPTGEPLGPVDVTTWAYAAGGALMGVLVALALFVARGA